jgi:hypothetical protein
MATEPHKHNLQQNLSPNSALLTDDERRLASARKYREIRNQLGRAFQITQAEAEASYCLWEAQNWKAP